LNTSARTRVFIDERKCNCRQAETSFLAQGACARSHQGARHAIGGYSIIQAESADAASKMFGKDQPHLQMPGSWIEITEILEMPGM
jgi:hypothetical protein